MEPDSNDSNSQKADRNSKTQIQIQNCQNQQKINQKRKIVSQIEQIMIKCEAKLKTLMQQSIQKEITQKQKLKLFRISQKFQKNKSVIKEPIIKEINKNRIRLRKQDIINQLKNKIEELKRKIEDAKRQGEILNNMNNQYLNEPSSQKNLVDPQMLFQQELFKKNSNLTKQIDAQKELKMEILSRVLKIYKNNWKIYSVRKYFTVQNTQKLLFFRQNLLGGSELLFMKNQKQIIYKNRQDEDEEGIELMQCQQEQEQKQKLTQIISNNIHFLYVFHKIVLPEVHLPYKIFINNQNIYIDNYVLNKKSMIQNLNDKDLLRALGKYQANLQVICSAIGHQEPPLIIFDQQILNTFKKNGFRINGFSQLPKKPQQYLRELRMQSILDSNTVKQNQYESSKMQDQQFSEAGSLPGLCNIKSDDPSINSDIPDNQKSEQHDPNADEDDFYQILQ